MIKIAFTDFWKEFDINNNFITSALDKIVEYEVIDVNKELGRKEEVQYLFYSVFSNDYLTFDCIRIFYTGENAFPDFNLCDYAIGFEHLTFGDRYIRYPLYLACYMDAVDKMMSRDISYEAWLKRSGSCAMVVSNGTDSNSYRDDIFDALSTKIKVDSGGRYRNNIGEPNGVINKEAFLNNYRFSLAIENTSHPGYCTEKLVESYAAGTIPIYWGDPKVEDYFNPDSFINCHRFKSSAEAAEYIVSLDYDTIKRMLSVLPIINPAYEPQNMQKGLLDWLSTLFSIQYMDAFRRPRDGWAVIYEKKKKESINIENLFKNDKRYKVINKIFSIK